MPKKIISSSMLYKVCRGLRNLSPKKAKEIAAITKTDPFLWVDPDKSGKRKDYEKAIELSGVVK